MSRRRDVLHTSFLAFVGQATGLAFAFLASILIARSLGEEGFGYFTLLTTFLNVAVLLPDFGLNWILHRELSRLQVGKATLTGNALLFRFMLFLAVVCAVNVIFVIVGTDTQFVFLANVILLNFVFSSRISGLRLVLESSYRAEMRLLIPVLFSFFDSMLLVSGLWFVPSLTRSLDGIVVWYTLAHIPGFIALFWLLYRDGRIRFQPDKQELKRLFVVSAPLALFVAVSTLYNTADVLLLQWFRGSGEVGQYGVALRLFGPFFFLPNAFIVGTLSIFSKWFTEGSDRIRGAFQLCMKLMLGIGALVMLGMVIFAEEIIRLFFSAEFSDSIVLVQILSTVQMVMFFNAFGMSFLTAVNRQKSTLLVALTILTVSLVVNVLTIPSYGNVAAAVVRGVAEAGGALVLLWHIRTYLDKEFLMNGFKIFAGGGGALTIALLAYPGNSFVQIVIAVGMFFGWVFVARTVTRAEVQEIRLFLKSVVAGTS